MKFIISKETLVENLQKVLGPTTTKQNFPILNSILLSSSKNSIKITATDLDTTIISSFKAEITEPGEIAIPMKRFFSIVRELPPQKITIEKIKNNLLIKCEKVEFKINTVNPEEFPQTQKTKSTSLITLNIEELEEKR